MPPEDTITPAENSAETAAPNMAQCSICGAESSFQFDEEHGYYKKCSRCDNIEYLNRRFLRLDRRSRRWY